MKIVLPTVLVSSTVILAGTILACFKLQGTNSASSSSFLCVYEVLWNIMGGNFLGAARKRNREDHRKLEFILGGTGTSDGLGEGNTAQDFEFPFVRFEDIVVATDNFSEACKIGQGGFGKVYKVISSLSTGFCLIQSSNNFYELHVCQFLFVYF